MARVLDPGKTKIAQRVVEVFEYFDAQHPTATVMDIVRRYGRPQSSTSELLASLVEMGLLYKDAWTRAYAPTPRLAALGTAVQPKLIRSGKLLPFLDRLAASTRHAAALFGVVGTHVQIFAWAPGADVRTHDLGCGASEPLSSSEAGLLLLSTLSQEQTGRMLWRLNAEVEPDAKFNTTALNERIVAYRRDGYAVGPAGFVPGLNVTAVLLPGRLKDRPLALGLIHEEAPGTDSSAIVKTLLHGLSQCEAAEDSPIRQSEAAPLMMVV